MIPAGLLIISKSSSSYIISSLNLYGFKEASLGFGISRFISSPVETFFDGSIIIKSLSFNFSLRIKFLILVRLINSSLLLMKTSSLRLFSFYLTIKLMVFFIKCNINTICACSSTG